MEESEDLKSQDNSRIVVVSLYGSQEGDITSYALMLTLPNFQIIRILFFHLENLGHGQHPQMVESMANMMTSYKSNKQSSLTLKMKVKVKKEKNGTCAIRLQLCESMLAFF